MYAMTAAHKTLPLPCYARVTNLRNGRSVVVRVNDRGPFVANRIIDLSYTAAVKLDMLREGTTFVEVRTVSALSGSGAPSGAGELRAGSASEAAGAAPVEVAAAAPMYLQAGAFATQTNALRLVERLHAGGVANAFVHTQLGAAAPLFKVRVGPVHSVADFDRLAARLAELGVADARLALE
jgi:rare lipoprotein A